MTEILDLMKSVDICTYMEEKLTKRPKISGPIVLKFQTTSTLTSAKKGLWIIPTLKN